MFVRSTATTCPVDDELQFTLPFGPDAQLALDDTGSTSAKDEPTGSETPPTAPAAFVVIVVSILPPQPPLGAAKAKARATGTA
jgi:hypothetical protein